MCMIPYSYNELDQLTKLDQEQYVYEYGWDREKEHLASKNKYLYTLDNPYKYVDRDGNSPSSSRTRFPNAAKGELAVRQIALSFTFMDFERNVLKFFNQKYHEDGKREYIKRKPFARTSDMSIIKLKAAPSKPFIGPPAPQKKTNTSGGNSGNGSGKNNTSGNSGGSNQNKVEKPKVEPACPDKEWTYEEVLKVISKENLVEETAKKINLYGAINKMIEHVSSGVKVNGLSVFLSHIKPLKIANKTLSIKGSQDVVKKMLSLSTGGNRNLANTLKRTAKGQAFKFSTVISAFISAGVDIIAALVDCLLGIITVVRVVATGLSSLLYQLIKTMAVVAFRAAITPFIGPFSWLVAMLLDWGIDSLSWIISIRKVMTDLAEWLVNQSFIGKCLQALSKVL